MVEERINQKLVFNQPAGHLEANETLVAAAYRETLEETGWQVSIDKVLGIALYTSPSNGITYHRTTFIGTAISQLENPILDEGIERAVWMSYEDILLQQDKLRSPLVLKTISQYLTGQAFPLELIYGVN